MKKTRKALLSVLLSVALLCGMIAPALAWTFPSTVNAIDLVSADEDFWFDLRNYYDGHWLDSDTALSPGQTCNAYSRDGIVWFTDNAWITYLPGQPIPTAGDPNSEWTTGTIGSGYYSPDNGKIWICSPGTANWTRWTMYQACHPELYNNGTDVLVYASYYGNVYRTSSAYGPCYPVRVIENSSYPFNTSPMRINVNKDADVCVEMAAEPYIGMLSWTNALTTYDFRSVDNSNATPSNDPMLNPAQDCYLEMPANVSFDPYTRSLAVMTGFDNNGISFMNYGGQIITNPGQPFYHAFCLRSERDQDIQLQLSIAPSGPSYATYAMIDYMDFVYNNPGSVITDPSQAILLTGRQNATYFPLHINGGQVSITDVNGNFIIDQAELADTSDAYLGQQVSISPDNYAYINLHMQAGRIYRLPIACWMEGQSSQSIGGLQTDAVNVMVNIVSPYRDTQAGIYPLTYAVKSDNTAVILRFDESYLIPYSDGVAGDRSGIGCVYNPTNGLLTLPSEIAGHTVSEINDYALYAATSYLNTGTCKVRQVALPDSVELVGLHAFGSDLERLHAAPNVQMYASTFDTPNASLVICAEQAGGITESFADNCNIPFETCYGHTAGVLQLTGPTEPVYTGDTMQVTLRMPANPGLAGMLLHLQYDATALTLTGVTPAGMFNSGSLTLDELTEAPFDILWDDGVGTEHYEVGNLMTFTFEVKDSAAAGTSAISLTYDTDSTLNIQLDEVPLQIGPGITFTIVKHTPGDADGNGEVTLQDAVKLSQYIVGGWGRTVDVRNSDVNGDGILNLKDVILIRRYVAGGWNVVLR